MKYILVLFSFLFLHTISAQKIHTVGDLEMTFEAIHYDLGKVKKGEKREFEYVFTNTGKEKIRIAIVSSCDCTTTDWPRKKIAPGEKGVIPIIFDSTEKEESETVDVDIYLENTDPKTGGQIFKIVTYSFELVD